ncbi:MAG: HAD family hydrolase [Sphingomonas sp.]|jgi:FMN phosphatase YigB (HAD superfamily)|uniref:HAD family hydrolase n=1 Tax=Sphingomonas sp. TaxID=28214 RepID=UPI00356A1DAB
MTTTIRPHEIATLLDHAPAGIKTLSLDCFDTLLWRATQLPQDVFAEFGDAGGGIEGRVAAEKTARHRRVRRDGQVEVSIEEIHAARAGRPDPDGVAHELALEARHCYAFAPTVALIAAAKAAGLGVIVVSDTYLSEPQLRALIASAAGEDVAAQIDHIFCSSEFGMSKADGLFKPVLAALGVRASTILHVGDNPHADGDAADAAGLHAVHIEQFDAPTAKRLRLEAAASVMVDPATRVSKPAIQPHRAALALRPENDAAWSLGHDVFGPVFDAFARWVGDEAAALATATGRPVKPLFLLRDGFLPHRVFEALGSVGAAVAISRFTARRASFTDIEAIHDYLDNEATDRLDALAPQLGLAEAEARKIGTTNRDFRRNVLQPATVSRIVARSAAFAKRLIAHVTREARIERGDIVMLIDLGYHGTVQRLIAPLLENALGVTVEGRYLLSRDCCPAIPAKRGMIDSRHYDHRAITAFCRQIAIVEQVATSGAGSVIDYHDNGRPVRRANRVSPAQARTRDRIQAGVLAFAQTAPAAVHRAPVSDDGEARRRMTTAILARLLFLPQAEEVALFGTFEHDVNLGTDDLVDLVDDDSAGAGLRRRGLPYLRSVDRMFLPGELQRHGLPLSLSLFASNCLELDLRSGDFNVAALPVPVLMVDATRQMTGTFDAYATHEGYHALTIPVGNAQFSVGVQLGLIGSVIQLDEVAFYRVSDFQRVGGLPPRPIAAVPVHDAMTCLADDLWQCHDNSLLFVSPPAMPNPEPLLLSVVFRSVVSRPATALRAVA